MKLRLQLFGSRKLQLTHLDINQSRQLTFARLGFFKC